MVFWAPCVILPLMAVMKFFEWIFSKFFAKKNPTGQTADSISEKQPIASSSGCPFATMGISVPNPHIKTENNSNEKLEKLDWFSNRLVTQTLITTLCGLLKKMIKL